MDYFETQKLLHCFLGLFGSFQSLSHFRLCDPMGCSMPGFTVHHQLLELYYSLNNIIQCDVPFL